MVHISDPLNPNPVTKTEQHYQVSIHRLINATLLGIVTYDTNLLIIQPKKGKHVLTYHHRKSKKLEISN